jgi:hypothetical protein
MNDRLSTIYQHDPNIVSRLIAGEMVLVPIRNNVGDMECIYTLNETAARIWELIDGQRSLAQVQQQVIGEFEISPRQAELDLLELIDSLLDNGALTKKQV